MMKKITLLVSLLFITVAFAQEISIIDRPSANATSIISTEGSDGTGVYAADSFTTTEEFGLSSITLHGEASGTDFTAALNVIIYANNGGTPGNGVQPQIAGMGIIELKGITSENYSINQEASVQSITIDLTGANGGESPVLVAGTYWLVCYPSATSPTLDDDGRWNWYLSSNSAPFETLLIDPQDLFGAGATNWSSVSALIGEPASSFAWTMKGVSTLGVNENKMAQVSIYPNPAREFVTIKMPSHVEVTNASLYSVLGKKIDVTLANHQINVAHLSKGLYILSLETTVGTRTEKLIIE